jgi:hypothetical protein
MLADSSTASELIKRVCVEYGEGRSEEDIHCNSTAVVTAET